MHLSVTILRKGSKNSHEAFCGCVAGACHHLSVCRFPLIQLKRHICMEPVHELVLKSFSDVHYFHFKVYLSALSAHARVHLPALHGKEFAAPCTSQ